MGGQHFFVVSGFPGGWGADVLLHIFKHNFSFFAQVNFKILYNHGGFKHNFSHLAQVNYKIFPKN